MKVIDFAYDYYKLKWDVFTTIRGRTSYDKYKVGEEVKISKNGQIVFGANVIKLEKKRLADIPLETLKADGEFPRFNVRNRYDFMGLINSLRKYNKLKSVFSEVTIITVRRMA